MCVFLREVLSPCCWGTGFVLCSWVGDKKKRDGGRRKNVCMYMNVLRKDLFKILATNSHFMHEICRAGCESEPNCSGMGRWRDLFCRCVLFWHGPVTCLSVDWFSWTTNKDTYQLDCKYVIRNLHKWVGV